MAFLAQASLLANGYLSKGIPEALHPSHITTWCGVQSNVWRVCGDTGLMAILRRSSCAGRGMPIVLGGLRVIGAVAGSLSQMRQGSAQGSPVTALLFGCPCSSVVRPPLEISSSPTRASLSFVSATSWGASVHSYASMRRWVCLADWLKAVHFRVLLLWAC